MGITFNDQVVVVTGAGNGLGRCHAIEFAKRGAKVVVNDFGGARDGTGASSDAALAVVAEIETAGGEALANGADVTDMPQVQTMVEQTIAQWGRVDVLVNNAGILRDKSFAKMEIEDWNKVVDVHLNGSANCARAVWPHMRTQNYGRIVMTTSTSGLYGNFGQSNYGTAKGGVIGLMNVLSVEGAKNNIRINAICPTAATRMTEDIMPPKVLEKLKPEAVTPGVIYLAQNDAPARTIMMAGAGCFSIAKLMESDGICLSESEWNADRLVEQFDDVSDMSSAKEWKDGPSHLMKIIAKAEQID